MELVVSRFNEDISWVKQFNKCILYNKGEVLHESNEIQLPNVGREGHTYLHHIIQRYDSLSDYTCFLQGNPFDHTPTLIELLDNVEKNIILGEQPSFMYLCKVIHPCNLYGCRFHPGLPITSLYKYIFNKEPFTEDFVFGSGAQFIVSKERILSRPKSFYENILHLMDKEVCPQAGYVLERFWKLIFT